MPSLQALSQRLKAVTSTARLTKTMKVVASVKLKVAQRTMEQGRPFATSISSLMDQYLVPDEDYKAETPFLLAVTTDKGLCGGINARIAKEVKLSIDGAEASGTPIPNVRRDEPLPLSACGSGAPSGVAVAAALPVPVACFPPSTGSSAAPPSRASRLPLPPLFPPRSEAVIGDDIIRW